MKNIVLTYSKRSLMISSLLAASIACLILFSGKKNNQNSSKETFSVEEIHQIKLLCKKALSQMPPLDAWDSLMTTLSAAEEQEALALFFVKRDLLQKLSQEKLTHDEFEANIRRYEETCDALSRLVSSENGNDFSEYFYQLISENHTLKLGINGRLLVTGIRTSESLFTPNSK